MKWMMMMMVVVMVMVTIKLVSGEKGLVELGYCGWMYNATSETLYFMRCTSHACCSNAGTCGLEDWRCNDFSCRRDCWRHERPDSRCGNAYDYAACGENRCCSYAGYCGSGDAFCGPGNCDYRCPPITNHNHNQITHILTNSHFDQIFPLRQHFYTYQAFTLAARSFPAFATTGHLSTRKRELAAFLAHVSQLSSGLSYTNTTSFESDFCTSAKWPCAPGKDYSPRGPIQLVYNYNYGLASQALKVDLINNPELVQQDPVVSFETAIWFWMTKHDNKSSCHDTLLDTNSVPRNRVIGNIFNRAFGHVVGTSCVGLYKRYCDVLGVSYGHDFMLWFDDTPSSQFLGI